jgi:FlaA1/EpsC-like NDP-sugar epimerase
MTRFNITLDESIDLVAYAIKNSLGNEIFIPKIPSYRIMDLAKSISKKCKIKILGIRPGEKIHEEMITVNDSFNTIENSKYYIILPSLQKATINKYLKYYKAQKINKAFSYNSKDNKKFLSVKEIKELIKKNIS